MFYEKIEESSKISPEVLRNFIWEGLEKREIEDRIELSLPWHFGKSEDEKSEPLVLRIESVRPKNYVADVHKMRAKGYNVDNGYYPCFEVSDGGRCLEELKGRLGSVDELIPRIKKVLYDCGMLELRGGRIIVKNYYAVSPFYHTSAVNDVLCAISIISNFDLLLAADGEIRKGGDLYYT